MGYRLVSCSSTQRRTACDRYSTKEFPEQHLAATTWDPDSFEPTEAQQGQPFRFHNT